MSRRIPNLQLDLLAVDVDYPSPKLYTDGMWAVGDDCERDALFVRKKKQ